MKQIFTLFFPFLFLILTVTQSKAENITIEWSQQNIPSTLTGYKIYYSYEKSMNKKFLGCQTIQKNITSLTCENLNFTKYPVYFSVAAVLKNNNEISSSPKIYYPPEDIQNFTAISQEPKQIKLSWQNPSKSDFKGTLIRFKTTRGNSCNESDYPANYTDGELLDDFPGTLGASKTYIHKGVDPNLRYCYSAFSYDSYKNYTHTAHTSAQSYAYIIKKFIASSNFLSNPYAMVKFTVQVAGETNLTYNYNFGDGQTLTSFQNTVSHKYLSDGNYTVTVTIKDQKGHSVIRSKQITVNDMIPEIPHKLTAIPK